MMVSKVMMFMLKMFSRIISVNWIKSFFVNFYYLPINKAIKFPILFGYNVKIKSMGKRSSVQLTASNIHTGDICIGLVRGAFELGNRKSIWSIQDTGHIAFEGTCRVAKGCIFNVSKDGKIQIGNGFTSNGNLLLSCENRIQFGEGVMFGWNNTVIDADGHPILKDGKIINTSRQISLGNHVWVGANATILKGTIIGNNSIVGSTSTVSGIMLDDNVIIAGCPGKVIKRGISWEH